MIKGEVVEKEKWLGDFAQVVNGKKIIGIGSSRASLESNYALKKLVGVDNFYLGIPDDQRKLNDLAYKILTDSPARTFSMKDVEKSDAVFVLGEDLTNTAPMLALAIRQAVRQEPMEVTEKMKIPSWNDAAVRGVVQDKKGPCYVASIIATKLDDVCAQTYNAAPQNIARLGFAVAHFIDPSSPGVNNLSESEQKLASAIANDLVKAKQPVVISGTSCGDSEVMKAASNIAKALHSKNNKSGIVLTLPECNSMGTTILGGKNFSDLEKAGEDVVIVLENDLYRHTGESDVDSLLTKAKEVIILDHTNHVSTKRASRVLPAGSFAEADGTLVSNEGRAQRFFQVYKPQGDIIESWRWIIHLARALGNKEIGNWKNIDDVVEALSKELVEFGGVDGEAPKSTCSTDDR
jgi:NADH-quinone oxidoreductase subunit G